MSRYNHLVEEYNNLFEAFSKSRGKAIGEAEEVEFTEQLLRNNERLVEENLHLASELKDAKALLSNELHKMKNENIVLLNQIEEKSEKIRAYENIQRISYSPGNSRANYSQPKGPLHAIMN